MNVKAVNELSMAADEALKKDIKLNNRGADDESKTAADTYASAIVMIVAILGGSVIVGAGVSLFLVRDVARGIASIVQPMQTLGKGDLSA